MKQEILEQLITDKACGQLEPDVNALLDAYLDAVPDQKRTAGEIEQTVQLAKMALRPPVTESLPPLKLTPLPECEIAAARPRQWPVLWSAQIAAAFLLGLGLSWWLVSRPAPMSAATGRSERRPASVTSVQRMQSAAVSGPEFWSLKRLQAMDLKAPVQTGPRVTWTSITKHTQQMD
jgi:anti-sigma factor RsiW